MRKLIGGISAALLTLIFLTACQKEFDSNALVSVNDSGYVKKFVAIDTTEAPGADTVRIFDFDYDAQKKLSGYVHTIYEPGTSGPGRIRAYYRYQYAYRGTDTLPYRIIEELNDIRFPANNYTDTLFYFYQDGVVIKDSSGNVNEYFTDEIIPLSPTRTLLRQRNLVPPFGLSTDTTFIFTNWQNGNLLQETDSLWLPLLGFYDISSFTAQYDTKPNPFKRLVLKYRIPFNKDVFTFALEGLVAPTANNMVFFDGDTGSLATRYQYRPDGLPVFSWDDDGVKCIYRYTRL